MSAPEHDRAATLSTGDELLLGQLQDTNTRLIAEALSARGIMPVEAATVGDSLPALVSALRRLAEAAPLVITTGGLGPTDGDLMRAALAEALGQALVEDAGARAALEARLRARGRDVTARQLRQAQRPSGARCLPNDHGTAPGLHAVMACGGPHGVCDVYCLPGPPGELAPMLAGQVVPALRPGAQRRVATRLLQVIGLGESDAVDRLGPLTTRSRNPLVGITASGAVLTVRMRFEGAPEGADAALDQTEDLVRAALGDHVFGRGDTSLAAAVLERLLGARRTLVVVESCTGGMLGAMLSEVPGSSGALLGGWITYSNRLKTAQVGVPEEMIQRHGAVSRPVAQAMAMGGLDRSGADHALAITGVAGPAGGTAEKPVGTVYIAHAWRAGWGERTRAGAAQAGAVAGAGVMADAGAGAEADAMAGASPMAAVSAGAIAAAGSSPRARARAGCDVRRFGFPGGRDDVRTRSARTAMAMLHFWLAGRVLGEPRLLWEDRPEWRA